jgi:hypothetical protein
LITIRRARPTRIMVCESIWKIAVQRSCPLSTDISVPQSDASCAGIVCVGIVGSIQALSQLNIKLTTTLFSGFLDFCWLWLFSWFVWVSFCVLSSGFLVQAIGTEQCAGFQWVTESKMP